MSKNPVIEIGKYFLYRHIRLDKNEVFYVGLGTKKYKFNTYKCHYTEALKKKDTNPIWMRITAKTEYEVEIMLESDDYELIKQKEIEFISLYGRKNLSTGTLSNLTKGGDGVTGQVFSEEYRKKLSIANTGKKHSEQSKEKIRKARATQIFSKESKQKRAKSLMKVVDQFDLDGIFIEQFSSVAEVLEKTGISRSGIGNCCHFRRNKAGEFQWRFGNKDVIPDNIGSLKDGKLRKEQIIEIKRLIESGTLPCNQIAKLFNIDKGTVLHIKWGRTHKKIDV